MVMGRPRGGGLRRLSSRYGDYCRWRSPSVSRDAVVVALVVAGGVYLLRHRRRAEARRAAEAASPATAQTATRYQRCRLAVDAVSALALLLAAVAAVIGALHA